MCSYYYLNNNSLFLKTLFLSRNARILGLFSSNGLEFRLVFIEICSISCSESAVCYERFYVFAPVRFCDQHVEIHKIAFLKALCMQYFIPKFQPVSFLQSVTIRFKRTPRSILLIIQYTVCWFCATEHPWIETIFGHKILDTWGLLKMSTVSLGNVYVKSHRGEDKKLVKKAPVFEK